MLPKCSRQDYLLVPYADSILENNSVCLVLVLPCFFRFTYYGGIGQSRRIYLRRPQIKFPHHRVHGSGGFLQSRQLQTLGISLWLENTKYIKQGNPEISEPT